MGLVNGCIKLFDVRNTLYEIHEFEHHTEDVIKVSWSPNAKNIFASISRDSSAILWDCSLIGGDITNDDFQDGPPELLFSHKGHQSPVNDLQFNPSVGNEILTIDADNELHLWMPDADIFLYDQN